jgi:hypothetical protein
MCAICYAFLLHSIYSFFFIFYRNKNVIDMVNIIAPAHTHTYTYTHTHMYMWCVYIYICMYIYIYVSLFRLSEVCKNFNEFNIHGSVHHSLIQ